MDKNIHQIIDTWFQDLISNTVVQRDDILYNKFHKAKEELKEKLSESKEEFKKLKEELVAKVSDDSKTIINKETE